MDQKYVIPDIRQALLEKQHPTVVTWNRLEGRPRTHHFDRSLKAEVRDALWMLTRQWQMGEFKADDAGSPFLAKLHISTTEVDRYSVRPGEEQEYEEHTPLEVRVEQKRIPFTREGREISIDIRLQMGRQWTRMLTRAGLERYKANFLAAYSFILHPRDRDNEHVYAHREVWQQYAAINGRCIDGYRVYELLLAGSAADDPALEIDTADVAAMDTLGADFIRWFGQLYQQPGEESGDAWVPEKMEYRFECIAREGDSDRALKADGYHSGHLDWYAFDTESRIPSSVTDDGDDGEGRQKAFTRTFIPSHVEFDGMPDTRWWQFEEGKTDLGDIKPSTTDLAKLLLVQFGLVYANDWFIVPFELPVGSLARVEGLAVTNNFGERFWIEPAGKGADDWQKWSMFRLHDPGSISSSGTNTIPVRPGIPGSGPGGTFPGTPGSGPGTLPGAPFRPVSGTTGSGNLLFLAPAAPKVHEGRPIEEVRLIRDEMANMVWGVESIIPLPVGYGRSGHEAAGEVINFHRSFIEQIGPAPVADYKAAIHYLAMTSVPENWIPFIPVHKPGDNREVQLQRSAMLRIIEGDTHDPPAKVRPRSGLLREGLEGEDKQPYFIYEEEVPRAGVWVRRHYQRTRWTDGEVFVWLGTRKMTGRGEGSSNLAFDKVADTT